MRVTDVKNTLDQALDAAQNPRMHPTKMKDLIDFVLDNTHLTYKYILITALASKATDGSINALALQAGSDLPGAYDARSVCHGVIVKFEMTKLGKALGGSNEPFLNKPARFPELSKNNAVRRGRDQQILYALCDRLPDIKNSQEAFDGLVYAFQKLLIVKEAKESLTSFEIDSTRTNAARLLVFIQHLLERNYEGEVLTLVVAGLYELYMANLSDNYNVEVHPVNQSGASSKEVSDLDIYKDGSLYISNELKDKPFTENDIRHAADKVLAAGKTQMHFIVGRNGNYSQRATAGCISEFLSRGFVINLIPVDLFVQTLINLIDVIDIDYFVKYILRIGLETKFKEETILFIRDSANMHFGV